MSPDPFFLTMQRAVVNNYHKANIGCDQSIIVPYRAESDKSQHISSHNQISWWMMVKTISSLDNENHTL